MPIVCPRVFLPWGSVWFVPMKAFNSRRHFYIRKLTKSGININKDNNKHHTSHSVECRDRILPKVLSLLLHTSSACPAAHVPPTQRPLSRRKNNDGIINLATCFKYIKDAMKDDGKYYLLLDEVQFMPRLRKC